MSDDTAADSIHELWQDRFRLEFLLDLYRKLLGAEDDFHLVAGFFLNTVTGAFMPETSALFRYDPLSRKLRVYADPNDRTGLELPDVSAEDLAFLESDAARGGIAVDAQDLPPAAGDFHFRNGSWMADWGVAAYVPIVPSNHFWGLVVLGKRKDRMPYDAHAMRDLAEATMVITGLVVSRKPAGSAAKPNERPAELPESDDVGTLRAAHPELHEIVGESPALGRTLRDLARVAPTRVPVLILGPTGTGKELAARALHRISPRAEGPFEVVDCGAIPRELIESELFGHVRGAFTGATRDRRGAFELAHNGTLFLDEVGELPPGAQTRLLRVLQEGQLRRVGDERPIHVSVRVVAATNRDLARMVQEGRFRSDLFYRVSVFTVRMPALADRREDVPALARHFLDRLCDETGQPRPKLSAAILHRLSEYGFPGNVRELQNVLTRLVLQAPSGEPAIEDLEAAISQSSELPARPAREPSHSDDEAESPGRGEAAKIGPWVVGHLRRHEFNLSRAERALDRLQRSPAGKTAAPVADRASLNYYLQGELLRSFHESGYDPERAARMVAGSEELTPRVRPRLRKLMARIGERIQGTGNEDAARRAARNLFPKMPAHYGPQIDAAAAAFVRGEWSRPAATDTAIDDDEE